MDTNNQDKEPNWEKRLENLRQTRRMNTAPAYAPLTKPSEVGKEEPIPKLDDANRDRVLKAYLKKWQEEHNSAVADCGEEVETDPMVILQENWLNAQASRKCRFRKNTSNRSGKSGSMQKKTVSNLKPHRLRAGKTPTRQSPA